MKGNITFKKRKLKVVKKDQQNFKSEKAEVANIEFDEDLSGDEVDIVFCIDTTGSMGSYITMTKNILCSLVDHFKTIAKQPNFGIVAYRDHPPVEKTYVTKVHQLGSADECVQFLKELNAAGGGDEPEAVLQGLWDSLIEIKWRENKDNSKSVNKRVIIHVGDAPPHGEEFHEKNIDDAFPKGCPSKITLKLLSEKMNELNIFYYFCRLNKSTDKMAKLFKENFKNFEPLDLLEKDEDPQEFEYIDEEDFEKMKDKYEIIDSLGTVRAELFESKVKGAIFKEVGFKLKK